MIDFEDYENRLAKITGGQLPYMQPRPHLELGKLPEGQQRSRPQKWSWKQINNSARSDNLQLFHWVKEPSMTQAENEALPFAPAENIENADYMFACYNKKCEIVRYTDEEYEALFNSNETTTEGEEKPWSKAETDHLLDLCERFDLRFIIIHDRFDNNGIGGERSIEDLKERYFYVARTVLNHREPLGDPSHKSLIASMNYDKKKDLERKEYVRKLFAKSEDEILVEEMLIRQVRKVQQDYRVTERQRDDLIKCLRTDFSHLPSLAQVVNEIGSYDSAILGSQSSSKTEQTSKKRKYRRKDRALKVEATAAAVSEPNQAVESAPVSATSSTGTGRRGPRKSLVGDDRKKAGSGSGMTLRSLTLPVAKTHILQQKVNTYLLEAGLPLVPTMVTAEIAQHFEELHQSILTLLELKKQCEKFENATGSPRIPPKRVNAPTSPSSVASVSESVSAPTQPPPQNKRTRK